MKIIPAIDLMDGQVVRLYKGDPKNKTIYSSNPIETAKQWESLGADILHIVDLDATLGSGENLKIIHEISKNISIPLQVAGGLRSEEKISEVLDFASRAIIGTIAMQLKESEQDNILSDFIQTFGNERVVISIDHKDGKIVTHGWQTNTNIDLYDAANEFVKYGFTEFLTTNVSKDGTLEGPDIESLKKICQIENCNVIASGGISKMQDIQDVKDIDPFGVILGKALYEGLVSIEEAKKIGTD
ncbi:MAG: 1-(5-phosphoribosyl)-5-[(5-phosphoribosylamino)methylideneamino]imidazole-4-carboxamide isomerase [Candidatus Nitrosopelagicus sp.]|nr:1-(5-phosphoribosyl)-5-[(5-phosphoribosylamino)methylideneamino]imidazole-4-carboxamide isomerase [Candidatus Nitrosopelagicus sp.]